MKKIAKTVVVGVIFACTLLGFLGCTASTTGQNASGDNKAMLEQILSALQSQDAEEIKVLFSPSSLDEAVDIDAGISYIFQLFGGNVTNTKLTGSSGNEEINQGQVVEIETAIFAVTTDKNEYSITFEWYVRNDNEPDEMGLIKLMVLLASEEGAALENKPFYEIGPGIYIP